MNSQLNTKSPMTSKSLMTIALSAIFFVAAYSGQPAQTQAQEKFLIESEVIPSPADTIGWVQSFDDAVALSESSRKPIMLVFSGSDWCSYCQLLDHEVFRTPEFEAWSNDNVIKVMVDFPQYISQSAEVALQNQNLKQRYALSLIHISEPTRPY